MSDLLVDEENPRLSTPNAGQDAAFQALALWDETKLVNLAKDLVAAGPDPSNLLIVMPHAEAARKYVVLEGNRRLAAIRALERPETLAETVSANTLKQLRALAGDFAKNPIQEMRCVVVSDRKEAEHWIWLRHTGENEGVGRSDWKPTEKARFRARTGEKKLPLHVQAMDWLVNRGAVSKETQEKTPMSSVERLLNNPDVRDRVGVELKEGQIALRAPAPQVAKVLGRIVEDLATKKIDVTDIETKADQISYVDDLPAAVKPKDVKPVGKGKAVATPPSAPAVTPKKPKRRAPRDEIIPRDCTLNVTDERLRAVEEELRDLSMKEFPNAVSVLFRVFVEGTVDEYVDKTKLALKKEPKLSDKLLAAAADLHSREKLNAAQAKAVRKACSADAPLAPSVELMHAWVHNRKVFPSDGDLRASWDTIQPFLVACWAP